MEQHWVIRFDENDGEPYGEVCECEIGEDHNAKPNGDTPNPTGLN